jgi:cytochrome c oxidase subunit 2
MSPNQILARNLAGVVTAIAAVTTAGLWLGRASREELPARTARTTLASPRSPIELGAEVFAKKGCVACHTTDGSSRVGPSLKGSWGSRITLSDGVTVAIDEAYVRESLARPQARSRPGYPRSMPAYEGLLTPREIGGLVAFLRSLE